MQWVSGFLSKVKWPVCDAMLTAHLTLETRLTMHGAVPVIPYTPSCHRQVKLDMFTFTITIISVDSYY
jgi:hypothetical protein